jgi:hypothetical protein
MLGESVLMPPNSPHAVIALEACYLFGHIFLNDAWDYEPTTVFMEARSGKSEDKARRDCVEQLRLGLRNSKLRQAHINRFIETWALAAPVLRV